MNTTIFCIWSMMGHFKEIMVARHLLINWWTFYCYFPWSVPADVHFAQKKLSIFNHTKCNHEKYELTMVGHLCLPHVIFNQRSFHFRKIWFFIYLWPKLINGLNTCVLKKKIILKTYKPSLNFSNIVPPSHLCDFKNGTSYFTTSAYWNVM